MELEVKGSRSLTSQIRSPFPRKCTSASWRAGGAKNGDVAWKEVFWSDVLQSRQEDCLKKIKRKTGWDNTRHFVMCNLSDAASYCFTPDGTDQTNEEIRSRFEGNILDMEKDIGPKGQIVILAHSLRDHITSNYIYDQQSYLVRKKVGMHSSNLQNMTTVSGLITFGCNIPVFVFSYSEEDVIPIGYPGSNLPANKKFKTWWYNFYDKDDILGFPMADTSRAYGALAKSTGLVDDSINACGFFDAWNPLSHNAYWRDNELTDPIVHFIKNKLR